MRERKSERVSERDSAEIIKARARYVRILDTARAQASIIVNRVVFSEKRQFCP